MMAVLKKSDPETKKFMARIEAAVTQCCVAKFGKDILPHAKLKHWPVQDGDLSDNEEHAGCWTFRASSKFKPGAIDAKGNKLDGDEALYSGAWYRASIDVWGWDNPKFGRGVSFNLNNVFKVKDDEKFGGGAKPEEDFNEFMGETAAEDDEDLLG